MSFFKNIKQNQPRMVGSLKVAVDNPIFSPSSESDREYYVPDSDSSPSPEGLLAEELLEQNEKCCDDLCCVIL